MATKSIEPWYWTSQYDFRLSKTSLRYLKSIENHQLAQKAKFFIKASTCVNVSLKVMKNSFEKSIKSNNNIFFHCEQSYLNQPKLLYHEIFI